jgi:tetratricopeptide (TPR) repeat protein
MRKARNPKQLEGFSKSGPVSPRSREAALFLPVLAVIAIFLLLPASGICRSLDSGQVSPTTVSEPVKPKDLLVAGFAQLQKVRADKAIACFTPLVVHAARKDLKQPENRKLVARYFALLGRTLWFDENGPAAAQCFLIAHRLDPSDLHNTLYLADTWSRTGKDTDALSYFKTASAQAATDPIAARLLVRFLMREEFYIQAQKCVESALKLKDGDSDWRLNLLLAQIYARQGASKPAMAKFKEAAKMTDDQYSRALMEATAAGMQHDSKEKEHWLRIASTINPSDPSWMIAMASNAASAHNARSAYSLYARAVGCPRLSTSALTSFGNYSIGTKKTQDAQMCLAQLQKMAPWSDRTFMFRAALAIADDKPNEAMACYQQLIDYHPHMAQGYAMFGDYLLKQHKPDEALAVMNKCTETLPDCAGGWRRLGDAYLAKSSWNKARSSYDRALQLLPPINPELNELLLNELAQTNAGAGCCDYQTGKTKAAVAHAIGFNQMKFVPKLPWYLKLIEVRPGRIALTKLFGKEEKAAEHILLGDMLFQKRLLAESSKEYHAAIELTPNDVNLHTYLLEVLSEAGDWVGAAQEDLETSKQLVGKIPEAVNKAVSNNNKTGGSGSNFGSGTNNSSNGGSSTNSRSGSGTNNSNINGSERTKPAVPAPADDTSNTNESR